MTQEQLNQLGKTLWSIDDDLHGAMNAEDPLDYMLSFLFLRDLSDNYEAAVQKELGPNYLTVSSEDCRAPLSVWYADNVADVPELEKQIRCKVHDVIHPDYLWSSIYERARTQDAELRQTLECGFQYIENESFASSCQSLFSEINLSFEKHGPTPAERNKTLCIIIAKIAEGIAQFSTARDMLGNTYKYLIGQFAAGAGKKNVEFYTPQTLSTILSRIVTLDSQEPVTGQKTRLRCVLDFACGSASLLLNVRQQIGLRGIGMFDGQEKSITTYNLARMNMLLHGLKDSEFEIYHGDTLTNDWATTQRDEPGQEAQMRRRRGQSALQLLVGAERGTGRGLPLQEPWTRAQVRRQLRLSTARVPLTQRRRHHGHLPHGVLFRSCVESRIRTKLLKDGHIDTVIGLPSNLFFSIGIPVCILVLKKYKKPDDVRFINAAKHFEKRKRQRVLKLEHIDKIVETYQF
ncbi:N-6 DNA methylase [Thiocapsa imhoffii]|uniref:N-6 DNA methylase n=1 Tax=Thiocapsa imhoffii TaxID=382777 RepID=UPI003FCC30CA